MNTYLLYKDREWVNATTYYDYNGIINDLNLYVLFRLAGREVFYENGEVKNISETDRFIEDTVRRVMGCSLNNYEELKYRQDIIKDACEHENFLKDLYMILGNIITKWEHLGRGDKRKVGNKDSLMVLVSDIHVMQLFINGLSEIKQLFLKEDSFKSDGLNSLRKRFLEEFSDEIEERYSSLLKDISFYVEDPEKESTKAYINVPRIVLKCKLGEGLKLSDFVIEETSTIEKKYRDPNSTIAKLQDKLNGKNADTISFNPESPHINQISNLEYETVRYIFEHTRAFYQQFKDFFDQLKFQTAFYIGAVNLTHHMKRFYLDYSFPTVCEKGSLSFEDLKEFVMCVEQKVKAVGNTCDIKDKMLLIVTGANQGGKSTFLRSVGIAQICMQCGLPVTAKAYSSAIFPAFFTHFTRREDSAMNSGRLDEELGRMNQIIENLGEDSLILLNESFATTTELEGSDIAYDIIKALNEKGVKILTVTHLLSFASRIYDENRDNPNSDVSFLSAERLESGKRTYKMIDHEPELTSFGLDLYNSIIGGKDGQNS